MVEKRRVVALCALLCGAPALHAQSLSPAAPEGPVLERALQQADGPRRRILEAARGKPASPPAPPAAAARTREGGGVQTLGDAPPPLEVAAARAVGGVAALPLIETPAPAAMPGELPPPPVLQPLKLLTLVEPQVPERLLRRTNGRLEFVIDLTIGEDGRVLQASVRPPVPADVAELIVQAVRAWRYAPQPVERTHQVLLVLNLGG